MKSPSGLYAFGDMAFTLHPQAIGKDMIWLPMKPGYYCHNNPRFSMRHIGSGQRSPKKQQPELSAKIFNGFI